MPPATQMEYSPSDGVGLTVGDVEIRNAIAFTADGEDINLILVAINNSDQQVTLNFQVNFEADATGERVTQSLVLPPRGMLSLGTEGQDQFVFEGVNVELGSILPIYVQYGQVEGRTMFVPVHDDLLEEYTGFLPTPQPIPTPTETIAPEQEGEAPEQG